MAYQAPYSGLAQLMEMQGRGPDTRLVHMTPMELRTLQAMSPTGRLTTNPETGLPEAGILEDILPIALPLAGSVLFPMAAPTLLGSTVLPAAVGAGLGSTAAGLAQGRGLGESLIQGGLSGLMSYGLGSAMGAFAPSGGGVTAAPVDPATASLGYEASGVVPTYAEISSAVTPAATESTGLFGSLGEMAKTPVLPETMAGAFPESYAAAQAAQAVPTYGSAAAAGLSGALAAPVGQGLGLMAPDEMPFALAYDEYDPYFDADLEGGRERGRARARMLQRPPAFSSPAELRRMATTGGFGTFLAADGGQVPNPYGDPYGPGDPYGGVADETDYGQSSGTGQSADVGPGMSLGLNEPVADIGLGSFNPTPMSLGLAALGMVPGPIGMIANVANIGRGLANVMGPSVPGQVSGYGTPTAGPQGIGTTNTGQSVDPNFEAVSEGYGGTGMGGEDSGSGDQGDTGVGHGAGEGTSEEGATDLAQGGVVQAGIGGLLKSLSPAYMFTQKPEMFSPAYMFAKKPEMFSPAYMLAKKPERLSPAYMLAKNPEMMSPAYMAAEGKSPIETVMKNMGMAQGGGISSLAYGGDPAPIGFANQAFEGMVPGQGTGMSDDVPFSIEGNQPALLSRDEYVLPADVVSQLGDGSSGAGADMLDSFVSNVRQTKYGNTQQPAPVGPQLMTGLMRQGGVV